MTEVETPAISTRNPLIAFTLSLIIPGLGQVYNGQLKKGIVFFGLLIFCPLVFGVTRYITFFPGLIITTCVEVAVRIYSITDAVIVALKSKEYTTKKYNTWYYHLILAACMFGVLWALRSDYIMGIQTFRITTTSGEPTLLPGDRVLVDKWAYHDKKPECGDIVIYKKADGLMYCSRIIGTPHDQLDIDKDIVTINTIQSNATFLGEKSAGEFTGVDTMHRKIEILEEEFPNGLKHKLYRFNIPYDYNKANIKTIMVPDSSYYLMGDNRDLAMDSRYIGFVKGKDIIGRIVFSYWGETKNRINVNFRDK